MSASCSQLGFGRRIMVLFEFVIGCNVIIGSNVIAFAQDVAVHVHNVEVAGEHVYVATRHAVWTHNVSKLIEMANTKATLRAPVTALGSIKVRELLGRTTADILRQENFLLYERLSTALADWTIVGGFIMDPHRKMIGASLDEYTYPNDVVERAAQELGHIEYVNAFPPPKVDVSQTPVANGVAYLRYMGRGEAASLLRGAQYLGSALPWLGDAKFVGIAQKFRAEDPLKDEYIDEGEELFRNVIRDAYKMSPDQGPITRVRIEAQAAIAHYQRESRQDLDDTERLVRETLEEYLH